MRPHASTRVCGSLVCFSGPALLSAHTSAITSYRIAPLTRHTVATGAREESVKLWTLPDDVAGGAKDTVMPDAPSTVVPIKGSRRVDSIRFHPCADSVFAASTGSNRVAVCDGSAAEVVVQLEGATDRITSFAWSDDGSQLAAASRDKQLRLFDSRVGTSVASVQAHTSSKGFEVTFVPRFDPTLGQVSFVCVCVCGNFGGYIF